MEKSYFIRFTPKKSGIYQLGHIKYVLDNLDPNPNKYVIGKEQASSEHFHIAIWINHMSEPLLRYHLKDKLEGQVYISGKEIINKIQAIAYCLKDGNYVTKDLNIIEFLQAASISKPKLKFDDLVKEAEDCYEGNDKKFLVQLFDAHIKTNKKVYPSHIRAQLLLTKLKKEKYGTYKEYLVDKILAEL